MIPVPLTALIAVAVTLLLSIGGNLYQWRTSAVNEAEQAAAIVLATEQGKTAALAEKVERERVIAEQRAIDETALLTELAAIAERGRTVRVVHAKKTAALPPPTCAPGPERVDAANALYRGEVE